MDDSVIAKQYSRSHELPLLSYQYSGAYHKVIQGIGLVNLVVIGKDDACIRVDYRIFSKKIPIDGLVVHLKAYGFIRVFKTFSQAKQGIIQYAMRQYLLKPTISPLILANLRK